MQLFALKKQQGAVLAFSLVMLLLLTLVSISMIRQNKVQINVASNAGQQVRAFADVESALRSTQAILEPLRYQNKTTKHCLSGATNSIQEGDILNTSALTNITATIAAVYCLSNYSDPDGIGPLPATGDEDRCLYVNTVRDSKPLTDTTATDAQYACGRLDHAGGWAAGAPNPNACQVEAYTLHVTMSDANTGAQRTVESKFEIDCSGDLNP